MLTREGVTMTKRVKRIIWLCALLSIILIISVFQSPVLMWLTGPSNQIIIQQAKELTKEPFGDIPADENKLKYKIVEKEVGTDSAITRVQVSWDISGQKEAGFVQYKLMFKKTGQQGWFMNMCVFEKASKQGRLNDGVILIRE